MPRHLLLSDLLLRVALLFLATESVGQAAPTSRVKQVCVLQNCHTSCTFPATGFNTNDQLYPGSTWLQTFHFGFRIEPDGPVFTVQSRRASSHLSRSTARLSAFARAIMVSSQKPDSCVTIAFDCSHGALSPRRKRWAPTKRGGDYKPGGNAG